MEVLINYFSTIPATHRALILTGGIAFFWILEFARPRVKFNYRKWHHAGLNIFFTLTTIGVNFFLAFLLLLATEWTTNNAYGLLFMLPEKFVVLKAITGILLLDLISAYLPHYIQHRIPILWRCHIIHHSDTWVDTTSANRHHPLESIIRFLFTLIAVIVLGTPLWLVFLYQSMSVIFSQFSHANIALHVTVDKILSLIIVSPNMHKVHHHYKLPYTDGNYGNIFSIWDRIFGTYKKLDPKHIIYGIDTHMKEAQHNNLPELLLLPFKPGAHFKKSTE